MFVLLYFQMVSVLVAAVQAFAWPSRQSSSVNKHVDNTGEYSTMSIRLNFCWLKTSYSKRYLAFWGAFHPPRQSWWIYASLKSAENYLTNWIDKLESYTRKPDCFRRVANSIRVQCGDLDMDEDERVRGTLSSSHTVVWYWWKENSGHFHDNLWIGNRKAYSAARMHVCCAFSRQFFSWFRSWRIRQMCRVSFMTLQCFVYACLFRLMHV